MQSCSCNGVKQNRPPRDQQASFHPPLQPALRTVGTGFPSSQASAQEPGSAGLGLAWLLLLRVPTRHGSQPSVDPCWVSLSDPLCSCGPGGTSSKVSPPCQRCHPWCRRSSRADAGEFCFAGCSRARFRNPLASPDSARNDLTQQGTLCRSQNWTWKPGRPCSIELEVSAPRPSVTVCIHSGFTQCLPHPGRQD